MKEKMKNVNCNAASGGAGGALYFVGFIGALIYFWQQSNGIWEFTVGFFQAIFWPAFMVYELFKYLNIGLMS